MEPFQPRLRRIRRLIIIGSSAFVLLAAGVLILVPVDEKVRAIGTVVAEEEVYVYAPTEGIISSVNVVEGTNVVQGDVLLSLDTHDLETRRHQLEGELRETVALAELKQTQFERILKLPLPKEFWHAQAELAAAEQRLQHAATEEDRFRKLLAGGLTSQSEYNTRQLAQRMAKTDLEKASNTVEVVQQGLEESITREAMADVKSALARVERLKGELVWCSHEIDRLSLRAPVDGRVTLLLKRRPGEEVAKGEELIHVTRGAANHARLFVGQAELHRIRAGQRVRMRTPMFDSLRYGLIEGRVEQVALEPWPRKETAGEVDTQYYVEARIEHSPLPLVLGSNLDAEIILSQMRLWRLLLPASIR